MPDWPVRQRGAPTASAAELSAASGLLRARRTRPNGQRDAQVVELLGRNRLVDELLRAGLEVAFPMRDRGVDLIAYADRHPRLRAFAACPIQMKACSAEWFGVNAKYAHFPNPLLAYVWGIHEPERTATYAEALAIARKMKWTRTASWLNDQSYSTPRPSRQLRVLLELHRMTPETWWQKVTAATISTVR